MTPAQLLAYLGPALVLGLGAAALLFAAARMLGLRIRGARVDHRHALTLFLVLFFLLLTQLPLPDRALLDCSLGGVPPILQPFATLDHLPRLWRHGERHGHTLGLWLGNKVLQAAVMNFLLPAAIGFALSRHDGGAGSGRRALLLGAGLSLGVEITQLTAMFGLYPCPWRTFETDDLILNISGLLAGHALGCRIPGRSGRARPDAGPPEPGA